MIAPGMAATARRGVAWRGGLRRDYGRRGGHRAWRGGQGRAPDTEGRSWHTFYMAPLTGWWTGPLAPPPKPQSEYGEGEGGEGGGGQGEGSGQFRRGLGQTRSRHLFWVVVAGSTLLAR